MLKTMDLKGDLQSKYICEFLQLKKKKTKKATQKLGKDLNRTFSKEDAQRAIKQKEMFKSISH